MSFDIGGWIEVARNPDTAYVNAWFGVVRLSSLVDVADDDTERLFGLSKPCVSGKKSVDALAAGRGMPRNPSAQVQREMVDIAAHELNYGPGEVGGYTYAVWSEIREVELTDPPEGSQWRLAFALARELEAVFGPGRVRFVVWFCW